MKLIPSLLQNVELQFPLKTNISTWNNYRSAVIEQIGDYFGAKLADNRKRLGGFRWSEDMMSFGGIYTRPTDFGSWCTEDEKFVFRLICRFLNNIGLESWMDYNTNLEEWVTSELQRLEEESRNSKEDNLIELNKNKVTEEIRNVQDYCINFLIEVDGYL